MDPEERKKLEEAENKKPVQTGDVKAKMALLAGGGSDQGGG